MGALAYLLLFIVLIVSALAIVILLIPGPPINTLRQDYNAALKELLNNTEIDFEKKWIFLDYPDQELIDVIKSKNGVPGTHHSYSYNTPAGYMSGGGMFGTMYGIGEPGGTVKLRDVVTNMSVTQSMTLKEQFDMGIRLFDVRFSRDGTQTYVDHGIIFGTIQQFAKDLAKVLEESPESVTISLGQSQYSPDSTSYSQVKDLLETSLKESLSDPDAIMPLVTIHDTKPHQIAFKQSVDIDVINLMVLNVTNDDSLMGVAAIVIPTQQYVVMNYVKKGAGVVGAAVALFFFIIYMMRPTRRTYAGGYAPKY